VGWPARKRAGHLRYRANKRGATHSLEGAPPSASQTGLVADAVAAGLTPPAAVASSVPSGDQATEVTPSGNPRIVTAPTADADGNGARVGCGGTDGSDVATPGDGPVAVPTGASVGSSDPGVGDPAGPVVATDVGGVPAGRDVGVGIVEMHPASTSAPTSCTTRASRVCPAPTQGWSVAKALRSRTTDITSRPTRASSTRFDRRSCTGGRSSVPCHHLGAWSTGAGVVRMAHCENGRGGAGNRCRTRARDSNGQTP
jgi:hypothetical protein